MKNTPRYFWKLVRVTLIWGVLALFDNSLHGQTPYFRLVRTPESMKGMLINCLYQDIEGKLWVGTNAGLFGYDGSGFQLVDPPQSSKSFQVTALYMDPLHVLWIGTRSGSIFRLKDEQINLYEPEEGTTKKAITGFISDLKGNLWFSTYGEGLYYSDGTRLYNINADDGLTDDYCYGILMDSLGRIWTGTDGGISVCTLDNRKKSIQRITMEQGLPDNIVLKLFIGKGDRILIGMQDGGICLVNGKSLNVEPMPGFGEWDHGPVRDIVQFNDILWLSSDKHGILEVDPDRETILAQYSAGNAIQFPRVNHILSDNQGNFWIATNSELLLSSGPGFKRLMNLQHMGSESIQATLAASDGSVWYSCEDKLYRFIPGVTGKPVHKEFRLPFKHHTHIISLLEDKAGMIWVGSFGEGLYRLNPVNGETRLISEKEGMTNGNILSIAGSGNELWLATLGGAYRCQIKGDQHMLNVPLRFENYSQENGPGNNYIYKVFIDSRNRVWFGTDGKGIALYEQGRFKRFGEKEGVRSKVVYSITEDALGNIWFSTSNEGVYRFDGKRFRNYTTASGLSSMQNSSLAADRSGNVFFCHEGGIDVLDIHRNSFRYFGAELGLETVNPDLNVASVSKENILWLGTNEGLIRLELPQEKKKCHPDLKLNKVSVFLGKENYLNRHTFTHNQNQLSFAFQGIWFNAPELVSYQVKLEGYDLDWYNTRDNLITYSRLRPGKYTFMVRAGLKGNFSDSVLVSHEFVISKPWWKQTWFIILAVTVSALLILALVRMRDKRFKQKEAAEREKLLFQLQTLRSQVNPHFLFNSFSTLISVIDENKELAIEYVQKLSQFFRNILEYRDKDLIPLREELTLIETYTYLQRQRYGDSFRLDIQLQDTYLSTLIPPLTLQMLIENAIKHNVISEEKPLNIVIHSDERHLIIVNNLQRKKKVESSTGIGLDNIRNRYSLIGMEDVGIEESSTHFTVRLPIIKP